MNSSFLFRGKVFAAGLIGILLGVLLSVFLCAFIAAPAFASAPKLMVYGDSLATAYGLNQQQGWVAMLAARLRRSHPGIEVINASVTGETTRGATARIATDLARHKPTVVLLELGGNDGLRGLPMQDTRANLETLIRAIRKAHADIVLIGIQIPPNYGPDYAREFREMYPDLAKRHKLVLVPFILDGIAEQRALFQGDGIHPTAEAQPRILDNVWPAVERALKKPSVAAKKDVTNR